MKVLVVHGGGPTAVLNSSLYGVLREAKKQGITEIYGAKNGFAGILKENFVNLSKYSIEELEKLLVTPGTVIGSSRDVIDTDHYQLAVQILKKNGFDAVIFNGGNGTMDTAGRLGAVSDNQLNIIGIPKTVDNDLAIIDHSPGFASAANFIAHCTQEIGEDVKSLPIHVSIIEVMGRNAGWLAAASALAKQNPDDAPHLIYLPEVSFDESKFLNDVQHELQKRSGVVVVVSEGLKNAEGAPITKPIMESERAVYFGDVGTHLANLVVEKLDYKARSEKPGIFTRTAVKYISKTDQLEAITVGELAIKAIVAGESNKMVGLKRISSNPYQVEYPLIPINEVMLEEKQLPQKFINETNNGVTDDFIEWCKPLIDQELTTFFHLKEE